MKMITKMKFLVLSSLTIIGLSSVAFGEIITKTFEIGEGTSQPFSHKRTFEVPCYTSVSGQVFFSRLGRPGTERNVPLTITLMQPASDGGEGEVVETKQTTATTSPQSVTFSNKSAPFGCQKTWSIRIKAAESSSNFTVKGEIRMSFNSGVSFLVFPKSKEYLHIGQEIDFPIVFSGNEFPNENPQGEIEITGRWDHNLRYMPIKMHVRLINPRGDSVADAYGYSANEINPCCSGQKLNFKYKFRENIPGVWKIRVRNYDAHIADDVQVYAKLWRKCP